MKAPEDDTTHLWGLASGRNALSACTIAGRASAPALDLANFLYAVQPQNVDQLDADLAEAATGTGRCPRVVLESRTPSWVEAELLLRGWQAQDELRLELDPGAHLTGSSPPHVVRPASELDPDWAARARMFRSDHLEEDSRRGHRPRPVTHTAATIDHRRDLERHATYYGAQRHGDLAGFVCVWTGPTGRGVIEDVFVHPQHRGHGIATSLLHHAVGVLRGESTSRITIAAEIGDTPGHLYVRLGFRPRRVVRSCLPPS